MKKLLNILSLLTLTSLTSLSTIACQQKNSTVILSLQQEEIYVVNAINDTQREKIVNFDLLTTDKILANPNISYKFSAKNEVDFSYDIKIAQDANTFLNNHFIYRIPQVQGNFTLDLNINNNKIKRNNISSINYLVGNYQNDIDNLLNILTGSTNNFTLIMDPTSFGMFYKNINSWKTNTDDLNNFLKNCEIYNANIILTKDDWQNIFGQLDTKRRYEGYAICLHVIKKSETNFEIAYTNLNAQDDHDMPLSNTSSWLPLFAFNSINDWEDGSIITSNNKFIGLNKNILHELNDIYTDNSNYRNLNWTINTISQLLQTNHFCNTNLNFKTIATCLINNWNINLVNNFLASDHEYFLMQYDANNNYVKNNWNM